MIVTIAALPLRKERSKLMNAYSGVAFQQHFK